MNNKIIKGIILIGIGLVFILINLGIISASTLFNILNLWPLILIGLGINLIFKNKPIISYILYSLFFVIIIIYGIFFNGSNVSIQNVKSNIDMEKPAETIYGELNLDIGAAKVSIGAEEDSLLTANLEGRQLDYNETYKNNKEISILSFENKREDIINFSNKMSSYNFNLNKDTIWDLDLELGAISGKLDLEDLLIRKLYLDLGAGNIDIILGDKNNNSYIEIDSGASNLTIKVPKDAGIKLNIDSALSKIDMEDLGLNKLGDYYISPNYEEANTKLDFDIDMGIGKVDFKIK